MAIFHFLFLARLPFRSISRHFGPNRKFASCQHIKLQTKDHQKQADFPICIPVWARGLCLFFWRCARLFPSMSQLNHWLMDNRGRFMAFAHLRIFLSVEIMFYAAVAAIKSSYSSMKRSLSSGVYLAKKQFVNDKSILRKCPVSEREIIRHL